jgi:hypothetical protein
MIIPHASVGLDKRGPISELFKSRGVRNFGGAVDYIWRLPFDRNKRHGDWKLVLDERCGTCSTKHAVLMAVAEEQAIPARLRLGAFEMTAENTPGIRPVLEKFGFPAVPELYCVLEVGGREVDVARPLDDVKVPRKRMMIQFWPISIEGVGHRKRQLHRDLIKQWLEGGNQPNLTVESVWKIREACIKAMVTDVGAMED